MGCAQVKVMMRQDPRGFTTAERAAWLRHVEGCPGCRKELNSPTGHKLSVREKADLDRMLRDDLRDPEFAY